MLHIVLGVELGSRGKGFSGSVRARCWTSHLARPPRGILGPLKKDARHRWDQTAGHVYL